jgi:hypothetical protein
MLLWVVETMSTLSKLLPDGSSSISKFFFAFAKGKEVNSSLFVTNKRKRCFKSSIRNIQEIDITFLVGNFGSI